MTSELRISQKKDNQTLTIFNDSNSPTASLKGRTVVELPKKESYRLQFEQLGISWVERANKSTLLTRGILPEGWQLTTAGSDESIVDNDGDVRVRMFIKDTPYDRCAIATFCEKLTAEEKAKEKEWVDRDEAERHEKARKKKVERDLLANQINNNRSENWTPERTHGLFYILDLRDYVIGNPIRRFCHGFFETEAAAIEAKDFLDKKRGFRDSVIFQHFKTSPGKQKQDVLTVNGFVDDTWKKSHFEIKDDW